MSNGLIRSLRGAAVFCYFLKEIPDELIEEIRPKVTTWQSNYEREVKPRPAVRTNETGMSIGQRVSHAKFGEGVITDVEGAGAQARVQVNFDYEGSKWLVLNYANLTSL